MPRPSSEDESLQRLAVDGRVAFGAFALSAVMAGLILLDRLGLPANLLNWLGPIIAIASLSVAGVLLRSSRISGFFSAARQVPGPYVGLAMAGLAAALSLLFLPPLPGGLTGSSIASGLVLGFVLTALVTAPLLRKTGALTLAGALTNRFPHPLIALTTGCVATLGGAAVALAGLEAASQLLAGMTGLNAINAMTICAIVSAIILLSGGVNGLTWAQVLACGLAIASLALPLIVFMARGTTPPLPWLGDASAFETAMTRLTSLHPDLIGASQLSIALTIALGLSAFHPFLNPAQTTANSTDARMGAISGLMWLVIILALAAASFALSTLALQGAAGLRVTEVPDILLRASAHGDLTICAAHPTSIAQLREACGNSNALRANDLVGTPLYLLTAAGELRGFGESFKSLTQAGLLALALALTAAGTMSFTTTLSHEAVHRWRKGPALTSQRLALARLFIILTLAGACAVLRVFTIDLRLLLAITLALSACLVAPLIMLSLIARATTLEALVSVGVSLFGLAIPIAVQGGQSDFTELSQTTMLATLLGFSIAALLCLRYPKDPASEGATFVAALLHGEGDVMQDDRGA